MNRAERRQTTKVLQLSEDYPVEDACRLCAFIRVQLIGGKAKDFTDNQGRVVDLAISSRMQRGQGLKWPKSESEDDQWAPTCLECSKYVMAWLNLRATVHAQRHAPAGGKIIVGTPAMVQQAAENLKTAEKQVPGLGRILLGR